MSLRQLAPPPFTDLACLDIGLAAETLAWLEQRGVKVVEPGWDIPVNPEVRNKRPEGRAFTARPFLRDHFPGYDMYLWIDADAWVQAPFAIEWFFASAADGSIVIVPQVNPAYSAERGFFEWRADRMRAYYGEEAAAQLKLEMYFNSGAFALRADAPHWDCWAKCLAAGLSACDSSVLSDQTALNFMLWKERLPISPLPALCNWLCHLATPVFDPQSRCFREPLVPNRQLGVLHLTANTKNLLISYVDTDGQTRERSLRFLEKEVIGS
jgi:hypothetical protein